MIIIRFLLIGGLIAFSTYEIVSFVKDIKSRKKTKEQAVEEKTQNNVKE